jgi:hypothetical protein
MASSVATPGVRAVQQRWFVTTRAGNAAGCALNVAISKVSVTEHVMLMLEHSMICDKNSVTKGSRRRS